MEEFITKEGRQLRLGYTTGSCAAAASKAAAWMLLSGQIRDKIELLTPKGIPLELDVLEITTEPDRVSCAIRKDSGDDPDVTGGALVFSEVAFSDVPGIIIDGGIGVGRVTKRGLDQPVGAAAINSVPRRMIRENLEEICRLMDYSGGLSVTISVPAGVELARKTFNPRLGIVGGISILGTTGIVEPMSEKALVDTIRTEIRQRRENGAEYVLLTPGNYGSEYIRAELGLNPERAVTMSNFIGDALDICAEYGFKGALMVGHIGKLVKLAGGMMNTHSKFGDCRMELLGAHAVCFGLPAHRMPELLACAACDDAVRILMEEGIREPVMARIIDRITQILNHRMADRLETGAILFSKEYGLLGKTDNADKLLRILTEV